MTFSKAFKLSFFSLKTAAREMEKAELNKPLMDKTELNHNRGEKLSAEPD